MSYINKFLLLFVLFSLSGCASFSPLPGDFKTSNDINGIYHNDPCINPFGDYKLWALIQNKRNVQKDSLYVCLTLTENNRLHAKLLDDTTTIAEKILKIKIKEDSCYYTKRIFYIVPILPILWFYSNEQKRFAIGDNSIILERTSNSGGAVIFMAGGNSYNDAWEYEKKK